MQQGSALTKELQILHKLLRRLGEWKFVLRRLQQSSGYCLTSSERTLQHALVAALGALKRPLPVTVEDQELLQVSLERMMRQKRDAEQKFRLKKWKSWVNECKHNAGRALEPRVF